MSPPEANAVRGEVVPFPAERIMWIRPKPAGAPPFPLDAGQVAVVLEGVTMVYASREAFEARFAAPSTPSRRPTSWWGHLAAAAIGAGLAWLAIRSGL